MTEEAAFSLMGMFSGINIGVLICQDAPRWVQIATVVGSTVALVSIYVVRNVL